MLCLYYYFLSATLSLPWSPPVSVLRDPPLLKSVLVNFVPRFLHVAPLTMMDQSTFTSDIYWQWSFQRTEGVFSENFEQFEISYNNLPRRR
jgi:hypothetical protein